MSVSDAETPRTSDLPEALGDEVVDLVAQGREQEYLESTQVAAVVREAELGPDEADDLLAMLADLGIEVVEGPAAAPLGGTSSGGAVAAAADLDLRARDARAIPCAATCPRSAASPLLTAPRRSPWPSASSATTWPPSAP